MTNWSSLLTEQSNPSSVNLDTLSTRDLIELMNREDRTVPDAVEAALDDIERAVDLVAGRLKGEGRLFYVGAGSSGRSGVIDAAECPPTFSTDPWVVQAIIAGGDEAVFRAQENAEDQEGTGAEELRNRLVSRHDAVVGIAASGVTPFVIGALNAAREEGAATIFLTCSPQAAGIVDTDVKIVAAVGPEILTGSTRLKAGTATKLVLNMISTGAMVRCGKVYGNRMVDLRPGSAKLRDRALRILCDITGVDAESAPVVLELAENDLKVAIVMKKRGVSLEEARELLDEAEGNMRKVIEAE